MKTTMKFFTCSLMAIAIATLVSCKKDELEEAVLTPTAQKEQNNSGSSGQESTNGAGGTVSMNGENGEDGENGIDGDDGVNGEDGAQGEPGTDGQDGTDGEDGADGAQGEPGTDGQDGTDGEDGADGAQGEQGEPGPAGENGAQGPKGDQGDTGPAGPKGDTGDTGPAGADGADGADGEDGNANVIASEWFEPKESSYGCCNSAYKALQLETSIKSKIKDGVILVYYDDDIQVQLIPRHEFTTSGSIIKSVDSHINHASNTLYVTIKRYDSDLTAREYLWNPSGPAYGKGVRFRYVIIPNEATAKNGGPNLKKMAYKEVMDHFGLTY